MRLAIFILFISIAGFAKTLFISDIDDTIKVSHVLSKVASVGNAIRYDKDFYGMSQLYAAYKTANADAQFAYVSAADKTVRGGLHNKFLRYNRFVPGDVILRESLSTEEFKLSAIRALIQKYQPDHLVLIGDNAERDPIVYAQIKKEFSAIDTHVFIHQLYLSQEGAREQGVSPQPEQILFVTAIDLAREFAAFKWLDIEGFNQLVMQIGPGVIRQSVNLSVGSTAFPSWLDCQDYMEWINRPLLVTVNSFKDWMWWKQTPEKILREYDAKLKARCFAGPTFSSLDE